MQLQQVISALGLIATLSAACSSAMAADAATQGDATHVSPIVQDAAGVQLDEARHAQGQAPISRERFQLSLEEMDAVSAGAISPFYSWLFDVCPDCVVSLILDYGVNIYE